MLYLSIADDTQPNIANELFMNTYCCRCRQISTLLANHYFNTISNMTFQVITNQISRGIPNLLCNNLTTWAVMDKSLTTFRHIVTILPSDIPVDSVAPRSGTTPLWVAALVQGSMDSRTRIDGMGVWWLGVPVLTEPTWRSDRDVTCIADPTSHAAPWRTRPFYKKKKKKKKKKQAFHEGYLGVVFCCCFFFFAKTDTD